MKHVDPLSLFPLRLGTSHYIAEANELIAEEIYDHISQY